MVKFLLNVSRKWTQEAELLILNADYVGVTVTPMWSSPRGMGESRMSLPKYDEEVTITKCKRVLSAPHLWQER